MSDLMLEKVVYHFSQSGNGDGTTAMDEELTVDVVGSYSSVEKGGGYLVLRTPTGWSVEDCEELESLLSIVENGVSSKAKKDEK